MTTWQHWVNFILGLWLIVSTYVPMSAVAMTTNLIVVGVVIAILALWGAIQIDSARNHLRHAGSRM